MKRLRDIMREGFLFAVRKDATVAEAARTMTENNVGIVVVLDGDRLVGVFSECDAVRRVIDKGLDPAVTPVEQVMTRDLVVASEDEDYQTALRTMDRAHIRHLPVARAAQVVSMLSVRDLMRVDMERRGDAPLRRLPEALYTVPPETPARRRR